MPPASMRPPLTSTTSWAAAMATARPAATAQGRITARLSPAMTARPGWARPTASPRSATDRQTRRWKETPPGDRWGVLMSGALGNRDVEGVQGDRDQRIKADEIEQLVGAVLAEGRDREGVDRLGQDAAAAQRERGVVGDALLAAQIGGLDARD